MTDPQCKNCGELMVKRQEGPSQIVFRCPFCLAAIEAPVQEPVAWRWRICYREEWCWSATKPMFSSRDLEQGTVFDVQPLYTTPPDALALVAAAYRDAAALFTIPEAKHVADHFLARTPADAQAALTEIERAAYERGVRDAAGLFNPIGIADETDESQLTLGGIRSAILALLTQEVR